jgi:hypothetical protein
MTGIIFLSACASGNSVPATNPPESTPPTTTANTLATPLIISCNALIPPDALYTFNPNLTPDPGYVPTPGTPLNQIVSLGGTACAWLNETSGEIIEIGAAHVPQPQLSDIQSAAKSGRAIDLPGTDAYFSRTNNGGEVQAFTASTWLVAVSPTFFSDDDARALVETALRSLTP